MLKPSIIFADIVIIFADYSQQQFDANIEEEEEEEAQAGPFGKE
jgi:hypothetical protein